MRKGKSRASDNPLAEDLDHILAHTEGLWEELRGKRIFITGGTGFFGRWILESFVWANAILDLKASAVVLTRNYEVFRRKAPHLAANKAITFHPGDVRDFSFPEGDFACIIHAATTSAVATFNNLEDPLTKFDTIAGGTRRVLDFAVRCRARKFLLTSSGVVYGKMTGGTTHVSEGYCGAPDTTDPGSVLGESKRTAELLCSFYASQYGIETKIARCFTFVGPHLPLDIHYAAGNFILDALKGGPIFIKGDGTPYRSYLYAADLAIWLWTILFKGEPRRAYNVGSEEAITIAELANAVSRCFQKPLDVRTAKLADPEMPPDSYVPSTGLARQSLGLRQFIDLTEAIKRTIAFYLPSDTKVKYNG